MSRWNTNTIAGFNASEEAPSMLSDEDVRKNSKVGKRNDFSHFSENLFNSEALSGKWEQQSANWIVATTTFQYFHRICWIRKPRLVSETNQKVTKNSKVKTIVAAPIFRNSRRICWIRKSPLVSGKNKEVMENRKVLKIVAAAIFRGKSTKNRKICDCVQFWT